MRWQNLQWQTSVRNGSPRASKRTEPQRQRPVRSEFMVVGDRCGAAARSTSPHGARNEIRVLHQAQTIAERISNGSDLDSAADLCDRLERKGAELQQASVRPGTHSSPAP